MKKIKLVFDQQLKSFYSRNLTVHSKKSKHGTTGQTPLRYKFRSIFRLQLKLLFVLNHIISRSSSLNLGYSQLTTYHFTAGPQPQSETISGTTQDVGYVAIDPAFGR
jgi:hypothetical protein